jgi:acetolactate synthase-1/2/3 large subunit
VFGALAKGVFQCNDTARLPEYIARAFRLAMSGRPGPVVLALPENMLSASADVPDFAGFWQTSVTPDDGVWDDLLTRLRGAKRPVMVVGGPHWSADTEKTLGAFASAAQIPVATAFRRQDYLDNRHPCFAGDLNVGVNPALAARVRDADALLLVGTRFGDIETQGYSLVNPADPGKMILHVHADADEIGRVYGADLGVVCPGDVAMKGLLAGIERQSGWAGWTSDAQTARAAFDRWQDPAESPGTVKQEEVVRWLSETLPQDAILTNGAGNYAAWLHRYFTYKQYGTQLAPTSGSMGYGFPAAIAAALEHPEKAVVCLAGDGCFQMTCNELSTAIQHGAAPIVIVMNNGRYGTIRMHQERTYPGRVSGTVLANPDYAALARAYGGFGATVTDQAQFADAFAQARAAGTVAVIECVLDSRVLSPGVSLA